MTFKVYPVGLSVTDILWYYKYYAVCVAIGVTLEQPAASPVFQTQLPDDMEERQRARNEQSARSKSGRYRQHTHTHTHMPFIHG